jgi:hypothetical protein
MHLKYILSVNHYERHLYNDLTTINIHLFIFYFIYLGILIENLKIDQKQRRQWHQLKKNLICNVALQLRKKINWNTDHQKTHIYTFLTFFSREKH